MLEQIVKLINEKFIEGDLKLTLDRENERLIVFCNGQYAEREIMISLDTSVVGHAVAPSKSDILPINT